MKVSNPLTVIAIFSGVAESFACIALIGLPVETQAIFVYFVMAFPSVLVAAFFVVLWFKNTALYAPSDFDNERHYLDINKVSQRVEDMTARAIGEINKDGQKLTDDVIRRIKSSFRLSLENLKSELTTHEFVSSSDSRLERMKSYTLGTLPSASVDRGIFVLVTDLEGGPGVCFSDGKEWKIIESKKIET